MGIWVYGYMGIWVYGQGTKNPSVDGQAKNKEQRTPPPAALPFPKVSSPQETRNKKQGTTNKEQRTKNPSVDGQAKNKEQGIRQWTDRQRTRNKEQRTRNPIP